MVTSKAGVIDSEGRRVTVQDRSGAILVRYPAGSTPAPVGRVIRASGTVGTWYDAPQLEADPAPRRKGRSRVVPSVLRRPPTESQEWRLVSVAVRITDIERSGDTWRAEASLGARGELPIVGLSGSGISPDLLEAGRAARIVGIVRRAHPSATDQRFAVVPRSRKDVKLGRLVAGETGDDGDDDDHQGDDDDVGALYVSTDDHSGDGALSATLGSLSTLADRVVRVGGRLEGIEGRRLTLDDGTARGLVRLDGSIGPIQPAFKVGEVLNVTGRVGRRPAGGPEVVVRSAADVRRATVLGTAALPVVAPAGSLPSSSGRALPSPQPAPLVPSGAADQAVLDMIATWLVIGMAALAVGLFSAVGLLAWRSRGPVTVSPPSPASAPAAGALDRKPGGP